ncbi:MAG: hypothetical protein AB1446_12450 [Bacillota bacterium]
MVKRASAAGKPLLAQFDDFMCLVLFGATAISGLLGEEPLMHKGRAGVRQNVEVETSPSPNP